jgi:hypothetical protein
MNKPKSNPKLDQLKIAAVPHYSMREPRKFEKGDFCPECNGGEITGDQTGKIYCVQQNCQWEGTVKHSRTNDYQQINFKLMSLIHRR